jgi:hypothetical protein
MRNFNKARRTLRTAPIFRIPVSADSSVELPPSERASTENKKIVELDFRELADGTLVETIEDPNDQSKSLLAIFKDGCVRYTETFECDNQLLVPLPKSSGIIRHTIFANGAAEFTSVRELLEGMIAVLALALDLSPEQYLLLAAFILATWIIDKLPTAPYLALIGPPGSGKTTVMRMLSLFCRRSLLTADISSAAFYEACDQMLPTLLIDEAATTTNRKELFHLLRSGTTPGFIAIRKDRSYKSYGARVVSWIDLPNDSALNSRCILISMKCSRRADLWSPNDPHVARLAEQARKQLLQFRLMNYKTSKFHRIAGEEELHLRTRDLFHCLTLPLSDQNDICEMILSILQAQRSLHEYLSPQQAAAIQCLFDYIHTAEANCKVPRRINGIYVKSVAERVNAELDERGEPGSVSDKKMGDILTSLSLANRTRTNKGYVLWLDRETRKQIHTLIRTYGMAMDLSADEASNCELCQPAVAAPTNGAANASDSEHGERRVRINAKRITS